MNNAVTKRVLSGAKVRRAYNALQQLRNRNCKKVVNTIAEHNNRGHFPIQKDIVAETRLDQSAVSVIISDLIRGKIILRIRKGREIYYRVNGDKLKRIYAITRTLR